MSTDRPYMDIEVADLLVVHGQYLENAAQGTLTDAPMQAMAYHLIDEVDHLRAERDVARHQLQQSTEALTTYEERIYKLMYELDEMVAKNSVLVRQQLLEWD